MQPHSSELPKSFQEAALSGDANAQFELGTAYAFGHGVPADPVIGYSWLTLAFANGDQQAESLIRQLTRQLSQSQIARIRWNVGEMYAHGLGVHADKVTAYMWHLLAELAGEKRSTTAKFQLSSAMTINERSEANARASHWLKSHRIIVQSYRDRN
jgi:TPR repeat protein